MYQEKLSIIIPTKNRQHYAIACAETLLQFGDKSFEIVIQDNSDDDSLRALVEGLGSDKIKYDYCNEVLSFCANFNKAVEASEGDYLILIGDDDCVSPYIFDVVDLARKKGIEAITYSTYLTYTWPNAVKNAEANSKLIIRDTRPYVKKKSCDTAVTDMVKKGNFDYQNYSFPKMYHGIIKREVFDCVKARTGQYFGGLTPDIYGSVALSFYTKSMVYVNFPLSICGVGAKSGSADSQTGKHTGELSEAPHFRGHVDYKWDERVPAKYSVGTIWAETAFKAIEDNGAGEKIALTNYKRYIAWMINDNPSQRDAYVEFYAALKGISLKKAGRILAAKCRRMRIASFIRRGVLYLLRKMRGRYVYSDVNDIGQAMELIAKHYDKKRYFHKILKKLNRL